MKIITTVFLFVTNFCLFAQTSSNSSGGTATGTTGSATYSVGQVNYTQFTSANGSINQGIQIPFEITTLGIDDVPQIKLQMMVYPNPTTSNAILKIDNYDFQNLKFQIIDFEGKQLVSESIQNSETIIQLEKYATGIYFLAIFSESKIIKTFKILKNN